MFLKKLNLICGYIGGVLILIGAFVLLYDVISRYALNSPSLYAPFIVSFLTLGAIFIGGGYSLQSGGQVYIEVVVDKLPRRLRKISFSLGFIMAAIFICAMLRACWQYAVKAGQNNWMAQGNFPFPSVILYGVMVFGCALLLLTLVAKFIALWKHNAVYGENGS